MPDRSLVELRAAALRRHANGCLDLAELTFDGAFGCFVCGTVWGVTGLTVARTVDGLANLLHRQVEVVGRAADRLDVGALEGGAARRQCRVDLGLEVGRHLVGVVTQRLLGGVGERVGSVAGSISSRRCLSSEACVSASRWSFRLRPWTGRSRR